MQKVEAGGGCQQAREDQNGLHDWIPIVDEEVTTRDQRVAVFNFGTDRVRVLEKTSGSGSGTDRVRVLALHFYQSGIIGY